LPREERRRRRRRRRKAALCKFISVGVEYEKGGGSNVPYNEKKGKENKRKQKKRGGGE
jgi:hypothetical protein